MKVSDHALLRWLERVHGVDVEFFRRRLLEEMAPAFRAGATAVKRDGVEFCIRSGVLVTVKPPGKAVVHRRSRPCGRPVKDWAGL